jgi:hypothetical protein
MRSIRDTLVDSHVGAATVAVLLIWTLDGGCRALWPAVSYSGRWLFTAAAILDFPYLSLGLLKRSVVFSVIYALDTVAVFAAAWIVSRWLYGVGPFHVLRRYHRFVKLRSNDA